MWTLILHLVLLGLYGVALGNQCPSDEEPAHAEIALSVTMVAVETDGNVDVTWQASRGTVVCCPRSHVIDLPNQTS